MVDSSFPHEPESGSHRCPPTHARRYTSEWSHDEIPKTQESRKNPRQSPFFFPLIKGRGGLVFEGAESSGSFRTMMARTDTQSIPTRPIRRPSLPIMCDCMCVLSITATGKKGRTEPCTHTSFGAALDVTTPRYSLIKLKRQPWWPPARGFSRERSQLAAADADEGVHATLPRTQKGHRDREPFHCLLHVNRA